MPANTGRTLIALFNALGIIIILAALLVTLPHGTKSTDKTNPKGENASATVTTVGIITLPSPSATSTPPPNPQKGTQQLIFAQKIGYACGFDTTGNLFIQKSSDGGTQWTDIPDIQVSDSRLNGTTCALAMENASDRFAFGVVDSSNNVHFYVYNPNDTNKHLIPITNNNMTNDPHSIILAFFNQALYFYYNGAKHLYKVTHHNQTWGAPQNIGEDKCSVFQNGGVPNKLIKIGSRLFLLFYTPKSSAPNLVPNQDFPQSKYCYLDSVTDPSSALSSDNPIQSSDNLPLQMLPSSGADGATLLAKDKDGNYYTATDPAKWQEANISQKAVIKNAVGVVAYNSNGTYILYGLDDKDYLISSQGYKSQIPANSPKKSGLFQLSVLDPGKPRYWYQKVDDSWAYLDVS